MFERRIKLLLILLAVPAVTVAGRLIQLQVFAAQAYRDETRKMLERPPRQFPCLRGKILDSRGRILASDAPAWSIAVQYGAMINQHGLMVDDPTVRKNMCRLMDVPWRELSEERIKESWTRIAELSTRPLPDLWVEAERIVSRVRRIKKTVSEHRGVETLIEEELQPHPVVRGLNRSEQVAARIALAEYPWIEIVSSHRRVYAGGAAMGQTLGRLGRVTDQTLANDPNADDPLARYQPDDIFGIQGVEAIAENALRGRRGQVHEDRFGVELSPPVDPIDGQDIQLTIDLALQEAIYRDWTRSALGTGRTAVILDVPTRNVLAMVGYPAVDPNDPDDMRRVSPDDPRRPFLFRAVRGNYHPGSIIKPVILAGGLTDRKIAPRETVNCIGRLFADYPNAWRCEGYHPNISAVEAIQKSCNVYFYILGQRLGVQREAYWMQQFGMGQAAGTGLIEEFHGRLPIDRNDGEARLAGIGQGRTELTPLQAANLIATVADGKYRPVTLWADNPSPHPPSAPLPVSDIAWRTVREGLYAAVNAFKGTAYETAGHVDFGPYVLLGKTGSAETAPPEWIYPVVFPDGTRQEVRAPNAKAVRRRYPDPRIRIDHENKRKPPEYEQTHAWFVGYLAPRGRHVQPVGPGPASIAIAVIVEYAGHGGKQAVPVAIDILRTYFTLQNGSLGLSDGRERP